MSVKEESSENELARGENHCEQGGMDFGMGGLHELEDKPEPWEVLWDRTCKPWTLDDLPMMDIWLENNSPALDLIGEAVRKPTFHIPLTRQNESDLLIELPLINSLTMRSFAWGLSARAHYRIGAGDIDGAIDDFITCKRLGRRVAYGATIVEMLVGFSIEGMAEGIGIAGSLERPPTKDQLRRLMNELDDLCPAADLVQKMRFERYTGLDVVQSIAHGDVAFDGLFDQPIVSLGVPVVPPWYLTAFSFDWNILAKRLNEHYDSMIAGDAVPVPSSFDSMPIILRRAPVEGNSRQAQHLVGLPPAVYG